MSRFESRRSRIGVMVAVLIIVIVVGIPATIGITMRDFDAFIEGVLSMSVFTFIVSVCFLIVAALMFWVSQGKKEDEDLPAIITASTKNHIDPMPSATLVNILEAWPGSAAVFVQGSNQEEWAVKELMYDRDYHRVIIRTDR